MSPMNATNMEFKTENELIDVIVAYSNVDQRLVQEGGLSYTNLKYSEDDFKYFEGLIKQLMECYSKSTSDFTIDDKSSKRIFYFGFTNAKMSDYNNRILKFTDLAGDFPIEKTLATRPNKVCTFAFLIFEDLSFSIVAFYNCDNDPLRKPFTALDYTNIAKKEKELNNELINNKRTIISNIADSNKKELAILASKIKIYLDQALERKGKKPDSTCSDFLKDLEIQEINVPSQPTKPALPTDTTNYNEVSCDPKTNPCCNQDGTLKQAGEECFDSSIISDCLTPCIGIKYKSACESKNGELKCVSTTIPFDDIGGRVYAPPNTICDKNGDGTSQFVSISPTDYCASSLGCGEEQPLKAYYGCNGQGECSVATFQPIGSVCSGETPKCCNGKCVNYQNDHLNCGECGNSCDSGEFCKEGKCEKIDPNSYCRSIKGEKFCPDYCEDIVHYYNGVCNADNICEYESEEVDCCSTQNCIGQGDNFKCVGYKCICIPIDDTVLNGKCAVLECGSIPNGCGGFFRCGDCDDKDPCTKDSCNSNICEHVQFSCNDGEECLEGNCVAVDSQEEGDSVVEDTQPEDLVESEDEEQTSSQPSEVGECKIDFGAITKNSPTFCRELGGNFFGSFLLKRYNWYKDINCPTKEYSYYSLVEEQSHLISYHCRDTCGGSSCGCDFGFGCEGCTENNGVILDCSKVQGSNCYTADENEEYTNQCNPQCVKAIDCRSGDSKVITGIDNSDGYKLLGCGYEPEGTSCVGENWMDGECDGEGRCILFECTKDEECGNGLICVKRKCFADISVDLSIMGTAYCTAEQMSEFLLSKKRNVLLFESNEFFKDLDESESVLNLANYYIENGNVEGVRGDLAFAQSILETGWFNFEGSSVSPTQNNFAGIGATDGGVSGHSFSNPREGVLAQIQHLKAYASNEELKTNLVDPRYHYVNPKGVAPTLKDLQGRWASGSDYAEKIVQIYQEMVTTQCKS